MTENAHADLPEVDLSAGDAAHDPLLGEHLMDVAAAGDVVLANAPGNGLADDRTTVAFSSRTARYDSSVRRNS